VGFFAGTIVNRLGIRFALSFGGIGYCIYSISLLVSVHKYVPGFNIFAGAFLGVCAGLLWAAQGTIMMSYPTEQQKGRYFAWFWAIFNVGACIGSLVCSIHPIQTHNPSKLASHSLACANTPPQHTPPRQPSKLTHLFLL
jgi:MFS family permease